MAQRCPRLWEVEASLDGRLMPEGVAELGQHVEACVECQREQESLLRLSQTLRESERPTVDPVVLRALRARTLEAAAQALEPKKRGVSQLALAVVVMLAVLGSWALMRAEQTPELATRVIVRADAGADFSRSAVAGHERIVLRRGGLTVSVQHGKDPASVLVSVPDGEITDIGTVFRVLVTDGRTHELSVSQGAVLFRRHGETPLHIEAPMVWHGAPVPTPAEVVHEQPVPAPTSHVAHPVRTKHAQPAAKAVAPLADDAGQIADEDLAYLHVVALLREQRRDEARLAARRYLDAFPEGLRRKEVAEIAR